MKSIYKSPQRISFSLILGLVFIYQAGLSAKVDDFNDANIDGWTRFGLHAVGLPPAEISFPATPDGGHACRMFTAAPPIPNAGPARAFIFDESVVYTDFYLAVDILDWDNTMDQAFGFLIRADNIDLGQTTGYVVNYDPQQFDGAQGQFQINRIVDEASDDTIAGANISLNPERQYRFVATGVGSILTAMIYDLEDLTQPITTISADDATFDGGLNGLFHYSRVDDSDYTNEDIGYADTTFDNYVALDSIPDDVEAPATAHSIAGAAQVVDRLPASLANFYPAEDGISFKATTLSEGSNEISSVRLFLNGRDVSQDLEISGPANDLQVKFPGLVENTVYDARIEIDQTEGEDTVNTWTFDTFAEDYLASDEVVVIEVEDYNYEAGKFQDNPAVTGMNRSGELIYGEGPEPGYLDVFGESGIDYFDQSDQTGSGEVAEYRLNDFVGTQQGSKGEGTEIESLEFPPGSVINDTRRQKYLPLDIDEYQVWLTEAGEWLNYTRTFPEGSYKVFLRVGCKAPQDVSLSKVTGDRTQPDQSTQELGVFKVHNMNMRSIYRYVPLTNDEGNLMTLDLDGVETLRLTMGGGPDTSDEPTIALNYLVFIPHTEVAVSLVASNGITAGFEAYTAAEVDPDSQSISLPLPDSNMFFRVVSETAVTIVDIAIVGQKLVLSYQ
jgi:hypothetical protein